MPDLYSIVEVKAEWMLQPETMGGKEKFWYRQPGESRTNWLFKYPRTGTGEHWAEKIVAEIAESLRIRHARVKLAVFNDRPGTTTESFARKGRELAHGNQVLARKIRGYDPDLKYGQSMHTLSNIMQALDSVYKETEGAQRAKLKIAEYIVLDALVGNTDRHHENWGLLRRRVGNRWKSFVAPSFDHASSLGRELLDERRDRLLTENRIGSYAEKGRGAVYWSEDEQHGPSPLELVRRAAQAYPSLFRPALLNLEKADQDDFREIIHRVPADWMSPSSRMFAVALLLYNYEQLKEIFR